MKKVFARASTKDSVVSEISVKTLPGDQRDPKMISANMREMMVIVPSIKSSIVKGQNAMIMRNEYRQDTFSADTDT